ncbi:MAG: AAA family ATPase [Parcubacteria group bacterium]|jgi:archaellum biogenesis ATPase FlaH
MNIEEKKFEEIKNEVKSKEHLKDTFKAISLNQLYSMEFPASKWVIEKLIPHESITIISGAPASFKSWLILRMALDIAKGESLLGQFKCEKYKVLIIDEENHLRLVQDRLKRLGAEDNLPIFFLSQKGFLVSKKGMIENVLEICGQEEIDVIFIDSLVRISKAEENDASQMSEVFRGIKQFCQNGKTVIITHHERKEGAVKGTAQARLRGSSDIQASVDCHLALRRDKNDKTKLVVEQAKLRTDEEAESFEVAVQKVEGKTEFSFLGMYSKDKSKMETAKEIIQSVLEEEQDGLCRKEIFQRVREIENINDKSIREAIEYLLSEKIILEKKGEGNTKICYLAKFYQEEIDPQEALI